MIDATRRSILKMFGVTAAAAATGAVAATEADGVALISTSHPWGSPYDLPFEVPEGMTYNWKRLFIDPNNPDLNHVAKLVLDGWKPVPRCRHHEDPDGSYWIEHDGMVLMEKPTADCAPPRAHPTPFESKPTGEFEYVHKIVIPDREG